MKIMVNSEQAENTKCAERQKTNFPKEKVDNTDLYKPVLNKIMTKQEQCVKYNFEAPLNISISVIKISIILLNLKLKHVRGMHLYQKPFLQVCLSLKYCLNYNQTCIYEFQPL